jgi:hypothetical protein
MISLVKDAKMLEDTLKQRRARARGIHISIKGIYEYTLGVVPGEKGRAQPRCRPLLLGGA